MFQKSTVQRRNNAPQALDGSTAMETEVSKRSNVGRDWFENNFEFYFSKAFIVRHIDIDTYRDPHDQWSDRKAMTRLARERYTERKMDGHVLKQKTNTTITNEPRNQIWKLMGEIENRQKEFQRAYDAAVTAFLRKRPQNAETVESSKVAKTMSHFKTIETYHFWTIEARAGHKPVKIVSPIHYFVSFDDKRRRFVLSHSEWERTPRFEAPT